MKALSSALAVVITAYGVFTRAWFIAAFGQFFTLVSILQFVFQLAQGKPLWDSGVRDALHQGAQAEEYDFPGLGPHSFRRANITWRQEVGGSAIEASKIAGHRDLDTTGDYTFVTAERQNELTRRIQERLASATERSSLLKAAVARQK